MTVDLHGELSGAGQASKLIHFQHLVALGVPRALLAEVRMSHWGYGVDRVEPDGDGRYQPSPQGESQVILPVYDETGELVDLVAFPTRSPHNWRVRCGQGWALGLEQGLERYHWGEALPLHSSPLNWLRSGCVGLTVIDWTAPEVAGLRDMESIICEDARLASVLREALTLPSRLPSIGVGEFQHAA